MLVGRPWPRSPAPQQKPWRLFSILPPPSATSARTGGTLRPLSGWSIRPTVRMVEAAFEQNPTPKFLRRAPGLEHGHVGKRWRSAPPLCGRWLLVESTGPSLPGHADVIKHRLRKSGSGRVLHLRKTMFKKETSSQQL